MEYLGIDPGTTESGFCRVIDGRPVESGVLPNQEMWNRIFDLDPSVVVVFERPAGMGQVAGNELLMTAIWTGAFMAAAGKLPTTAYSVTRGQVLSWLLHGKSKAKGKTHDSQVRTALLDRFGGESIAKGNKAKPGPLYGISSHAWPAFAAVLTWCALNPFSVAEITRAAAKSS